jgi:hypothetical protein
MTRPDAAFAFDSGDSLSDEGTEEVAHLRRLIDSDRRVGVFGICPSSVIASKASKEGWDYVGFLAEVVRTLVADGRLVVLFPNATRGDAGDALRNNDLPVIRDVVSAVGLAETEGLLSVKGDVCAAELRRLVEAFDVAGVSRFHAMIAALTEGVPVAVMGWSHKYVEVMASFGLADWSFDYSEHDPHQYAELLRSLFEARDGLGAAIQARLPDVVSASQAQFTQVARRLSR